MIEKAKKLLAYPKPVFLVTIGEDGRPDTRAISAVKVDSLTSIWMLTGKNSDKYRELVRRPECMLYATELEDCAGYLELRLWGRIEILDDPASRAAIWRDDYLAYFPGGQDDPNICVLKFTADSGILQTQAGKEKLTLQGQMKGKTSMTKFDVTVADYPAKRLIGLKVQTTMSKAPADCPALWYAFGPRMGELCAAGSAPTGSFGVCVMLNAEDFDYWAAVEAGASTAVPQGMGNIELPAGLYARALVPNLEQLGDAFTYLYTEWNREQADYICDETVPCFEWYPPGWQPNGAFEIFMAVKKR